MEDLLDYFDEVDDATIQQNQIEDFYLEYGKAILSRHKIKLDLDNSDSNSIVTNLRKVSLNDTEAQELLNDMYCSGTVVLQ